MPRYFVLSQADCVPTNYAIEYLVGIRHCRVREAINKRKALTVFICVVAPGTLESDWVQKEILWAEDNLRIAIVHPDYDYEEDEKKDTYPPAVREFMKKKQWILVAAETAKGYHDAVEDIINAIRLRAG